MKKIIIFFCFLSQFLIAQEKRSNLFGFATSNTFTYCDLKDTVFFNKVIALQPKLLRFPGGAVGNYYHLGGPGYGFDFEEIKKYDAGKFLKRSKGLLRSAQKKGHKHDYIDDFITLAKATNAQAILVVNMFAQSNDILKMITKMKENKIKVAGVELGSELTNRYFFQKGYTIDDYIKTCLIYTKKIRELDSTIKIGVVVAPLGKKKNHRHNVWNHKLAALNFYDAIIVHSYPKVIKGKAEYGQMINEVEESKSLFKQFDLYKDRLVNFFEIEFPNEVNIYTKLFNKPIWITEWNLQMSKVTGNTMMQGLFVTNYLLDILTKYNEITLTTYHNLGGRDYSGSIFKNHKESVETHSTYYPFKMISNLFNIPNLHVTYNKLNKDIYEYKIYQKNNLIRIIVLSYSNIKFTLSRKYKNVNLYTFYSDNLYDKANLDGRLSFNTLKNIDENIIIKPFSINSIEFNND